MSNWCESDVINLITQVFPARESILARGIGDDCAVFRQGQHLITTDASIEGVHFDLRWMSPGDAAYRCLSSNISDIAAMGGSAGPFTLALALPSQMAFEDIRGIFLAMKQCIADHGLKNCWLVGGDVVRSPVLMFSITMLCPQPPWLVVCRNGAKPGDHILAIGHIGHAAAGLALFEKNLFRANFPEFEPLFKAFCRPLACVQAGETLAKAGLVSAMMDLSDGIFTDLPRLLDESHCGADTDVINLVPDELLVRAASVCQCDPRDWMIFGGEDFGLLVTAPDSHIKRIRAIAQTCELPCYDIGVCHPENVLAWRENKAQMVRTNQSFSHF